MRTRAVLRTRAGVEESVPRQGAGPEPPDPRARRRAAVAVLGAALLLALLALAPRPWSSPRASARPMGESLYPVAALPAAMPALHVTVAGELAFVSAHAQGVHIVDLAAEGGPRRLATAPTAGAAYEVAVVEDRMYVAAWAAGLEVFDISDPVAPALLGGAPTRSNANAIAALPGRDVVVTGDWSATDFEGGDPDYGLLAFDVSDPSAPERIGRLDTPGWAGELVASGGRLYVADGPGGLRIVDVQDPTAMRELGSAATDLRAYGVDVYGVDAIDARAYVADNAGGLLIFDVRDPSAPRRLGGLVTGEAAYAVAVDPGGSRAWLAQAAGGGPTDPGSVVLVDVSVPDAPVVLDTAVTEQRAWGVSLEALGPAWVAATGAGLLGFGVQYGPYVGPVYLPWAGR